MSKAIDKAYLLAQLKGYDTKIASAKYVAIESGKGLISDTDLAKIGTNETAISDLTTLVGTLPTGATATTVVGYVDEKVSAATTAGAVTLTTAETATEGYLKTYVVKQGDAEVGKIDIPKDLVVTAGEVVKNPEGQPAGTYIKLTIANQTAPIYINVKDLVDVYTAEQNATQVQVAISDANVVSATIVAGSVTKTELATAVVTEIENATSAIETLNGTGATSVSGKIATAVGDLGNKSEGVAYANVKDYVDSNIASHATEFETVNIDFDTEW